MTPDWTPYVYPAGSVAAWNRNVENGSVRPSLHNFRSFLAGWIEVTR